MKLEAMEVGIPSERIFMDHAGFSTYESIFKPAPTYLSDVIPVSGDGNFTNDEYMEPTLS